MKLVTKAEMAETMHAKWLPEYLFYVRERCGVLCVLLSPPGAHKIELAYHALPKLDPMENTWQLGGIDEVHALLVEIYARQWEKMVPEDEMSSYTVTVTEQHGVEMELRAASEKMAVVQAMDLIRAGACETDVRYHWVNVVRWGSDGSRENEYSVFGKHLDDIRAEVDAQIGHFASGAG